MKLRLRLALLVIAVNASAALAHSPADLPDVQANVDEATRLARKDLAASLFFCEANPTTKVLQMLKEGLHNWFEPTRLYDNFSFIGNHFVGVFILQTSDGLIMFDSGTSLDDAENHIAPGLAKLGFDPKDLKFIVVTHGHWDHYGGALWFQQHYQTPVGLSSVDWNMIETIPRDSPEIAGHPVPHRDRVLTDGQVLKVGDTAVHLYITPGHTPGTVSAIFPVKQGGKTHVVSLLGSTAFPSTIEPTDKTGGLAAYRRSIDRFDTLSREAGADIQLNTHLFAFGGIERLEQAQAAGNGNSFVIGREAIDRYYKLLDHCMQAAEQRIQAGIGGPKAVTPASLKE
jgi:metallo-beta-lactamase class B